MLPRPLPHEPLWRSSLRDFASALTPADAEPPADWEGWLGAMLGGLIQGPFAPYHEAFWRHVWAIERGEPAHPFVAVWPRGFGKSSSIEGAVALLACERRRSYVLYVCETQDQADDHVQSIAGLLEAPAIERRYPDVARKRVGKHGNSQGWRRNRLTTASGFTVDAIGLDTAARGRKQMDRRPDLLIFDDLDNPEDGEATIERKLRRVTRDILPMRAPHAAVLAVQNLIHRDGVFARLVDGRADFLADRVVSGPHPAVEGLTYDVVDGRARITGGDPTWEQRDLAACEREMNEVGVRAFLQEKQHDLAVGREGAFWTTSQLDAIRLAAVPVGVSLTRVVVGVDPPASSTGAECGIVVAAKGSDGRAYVLDDRSGRGTPEQWSATVVAAYLDWDADVVVAEVNNGGDMVKSTLQTAMPGLPVKVVRATRGKLARAEPVAVLYADGKVAHVGRFPKLEGQMVDWVPGDPSPDRIDACVWSLVELMIGGYQGGGVA